MISVKSISTWGWLRLGAFFMGKFMENKTDKSLKRQLVMGQVIPETTNAVTGGIKVKN